MIKMMARIDIFGKIWLKWLQCLAKLPKDKAKNVGRFVAKTSHIWWIGQNFGETDHGKN